MVVLLLKFILSVISISSYMITRLIFSSVAYLLVGIIQAFKVRGEAVQGALEKLAEAIRSCFEYLLGMIVEAIGSLISSVFDLFIQAVTESIVNSSSAVGDLMEKTRDSLDGLMKSLPEMFEGVSEFISTMAADLWNNYMDALRYVTENA